MNSLHNFSDWEKRLHNDLKNLPDLQAPSSLIPHVLAQLQVQAIVPWWQRSWNSWSKSQQLTFLIAVVVLPTLAGYFNHEIVTVILLSVADVLSQIQILSAILHHLLNVFIFVFLHIFDQPIVWIFATVGGLLYISCLALGTALYHTAKKTIHS